MNNMILFGREVKLQKITAKSADFLNLVNKATSQFKSPFSLIKAYIQMNAPAGNEYTLKSGMRVTLSNNPHDSITVMVIFCRREYGDIPKGSVVIDVGANIGTFSLYAANMGASKVYAFEPNKESYEVLVRNIKVNNLENVIYPFNFAIGGRDGEIVHIPKSSSPYNVSVDDASGENNKEAYDPIPTICLDTIVKDNQINDAYLLKMDCEGAEYDALYNTSEDVLKKIKHIRLEHHDSERLDELHSFFQKSGFDMSYEKFNIRWYER